MIDQAQGLRVLAGESPSLSRVDALLLEDRAPRPSGRCVTLAVTSGKGGVGKTNVSINLCLLLAKMVKRVVLFDADLGLANVNILMGVSPAFTLLDVVEGRCTLADAVLEGPGGISVIPAGSGVEKLANLDAMALGKVLRDLEALESSCDFLLFDTGAGISRMVRAFVGAAMKQIVVVTPEPSSLADAYAVIKLIFSTGNTDIGVVANMVKDEREGKETYERLAAISRRFLKRAPVFLGALPWDKNVRAGVFRQAPVALNIPQAPFTRALSRIALRLLGRPVPERAGFFRRLMDRL
jgi:flagellar biosynthesis protein FlhG